MSESIVQLTKEKECYFCRALTFENDDALAELTDKELEKHHIMFGFSGKDREYSEKYGLWVWLCPYHHREAPESVHKDKKVNLLLRRIAQKAFEIEHAPDGYQKWMELFRENYL